MKWLSTLELSAGTLLFAFGIWFLGILTAVLSLIPLFVTDTLVGAEFIRWFRRAGLLIILGSTAVMAWIQLYLLDIRSAGGDDLAPRDNHDHDSLESLPNLVNQPTVS